MLYCSHICWCADSGGFSGQYAALSTTNGIWVSAQYGVEGSWSPSNAPLGNADGTDIDYGHIASNSNGNALYAVTNNAQGVFTTTNIPSTGTTDSSDDEPITQSTAFIAGVSTAAGVVAIGGAAGAYYYFSTKAADPLTTSLV